MKKFEYMVVSFEPNNIEDADVEYTLDQEGKEGWEAVCTVMPVSQYHLRILLKRELPGEF